MKPTILSMNSPVKTGATSCGSVTRTAAMAAMGAKRITLWPR